GVVCRATQSGIGRHLLHDGRERPLRPHPRLEGVEQMRVAKLFRKPMFGIFLLSGLISLSTSAWCVYTVDRQLSQEYEANSRAIAQTIANSSLDIILNRDLSTLQSLIDQFKEIQGIKYLYIANEDGDILAHTFVPGVPKEIMASDRVKLATVDRTLSGFGEL